jgi:arylsulfatase A-like enzyme
MRVPAHALSAVVCLTFSWFGAAMAAEGQPARPNIVFILADDLGYGDLACYGRADIRTPHLDRLAGEGVRLTQCYANGPEGSSTRAGLLTGRYQQRVGGLECSIGNGGVGRYDDAVRLQKEHALGLPPEETSIAALLKATGYATCICGKWHLGYEPKFSPSAHGFDRALYCLGGDMDYFHHVERDGRGVLYRDGAEEKRPGYFTDLATDEAIGFVKSHRHQPFFLYLAYTAPHAPFQGPNEELPQAQPPDSPRWDQSKAPPQVYVAMIERMDTCIGRLLETLAESGLADNTLIVFSSDNGGTASARNTPLSGIKGTTFEGGIRVPGIARWPGHLPRGAVSHQVCITMDFASSLVRISGAQFPKDRPPDGIDILQLLESGKPIQPRTLFWRGKRGDQTWWAVRDGDMKYVRHLQGIETTEYLFDLAHDESEKRNLVSDRADDVARLRQMLSQWERQVESKR